MPLAGARTAGGRRIRTVRCNRNRPSRGVCVTVVRGKEDAAQATTIFERVPMGRNEKQQQAKRARDMRTVSQMIALYCAGNHDRAARTETAFCGKPVCPACAQLDAYAHLRTEKCPFMETKVSCDRCNVH